MPAKTKLPHSVNISKSYAKDPISGTNPNKIPLQFDLCRNMASAAKHQHDEQRKIQVRGIQRLCQHQGMLQACMSQLFLAEQVPVVLDILAQTCTPRHMILISDLSEQQQGPSRDITISAHNPNLFPEWPRFMRRAAMATARKEGKAATNQTDSSHQHETSLHSQNKHS